MWIFLNDAFLSIVSDRADSSQLLVRARCRGDIERVFPAAEIIGNAGTDYRYRAYLPRQQVMDTVSKRIKEIDYDNFKRTVHERDRHTAYFEVWDSMYRFQEKNR